jgi:formylglycine-generating enzyme required for sulfatase activity
VPPSKRGIAVLCSVVLVACAAWLLHPNNRAKGPAAPAATAAVAVANALYAAIDVSGGPDAEHYPVTYLSEVPSDLLADPKWRTTTILLRRLSAGEFVMGTPASEPYREEMQNEETQHRVTLTEDYFIGIFEVTQRQWELVVGGNSSLEKGDLLPVANLLYHDIRGRTAGARHPATPDVDGNSFMGKLRQKTDLMLDLPTEAQWEYACRAGTRTAYHFGDNPNDLHNYGNYRDVSHGSGDQGYVVISDGVARSSAVGSYRPNAWGLYDMHGNVSEWCLDWYEPAMTDGHVVDPLGQGKEGKRSLRGLSWKFAARFNRAGIRYGWDLKAPRHDTGFRIVMAPSQITVDRPSAQQSPPRRAENLLYAAINVSGGANVDRYPVSYLKEAPPDLLADPKWRTTTLLLRYVPAGRFVMGTPGHEPFREFSGHKETAHQVTLTKDFYMGVFEVTQRQWELIMGSNPSEGKGDMLPVANLSYHDIRGRTAGAKFPATRDVDDDSFMGQLRRKTNLMLDLPTEAQWEYTCRANTQTAYSFGDNPQDLHKYGNYRDVTHSPDEELVVWISDGSMRSRKVGSYLPNAWGFYDMHGNVSEWCLDWHEKGMKAEAVTDPVGNGEREERALRGGSWRGHARHTRSGSRYGWQLKVARYDTGLRVILLSE